MSGSFLDWFCIPAFFVLFRETLEASVLTAVILQYLDRNGQSPLKKQVWLGAWLGGGASIVVGTIVLTIYYTSKSALQSEPALIFEGLMLAFACVAITYFIVTHLAPGMKSKDEWATKWEKKMATMVEETNNGKSKHGFFLLTFTSVFREGIESVIFIMGMGAAFHPQSLPIPVVCGTIVGAGFGIAMFTGLVKLDMSMFFKVSAAFLILISAGLSAHASYELQKAGVFGTWACPYRCSTGSNDDANMTDVSRRLMSAEEWALPSYPVAVADRQLIEFENDDDDEADCDDDGGNVDWHEYRRLSARHPPTALGDNRRLTERARSCNGREHPNREVSWANREMYDITACCDTDNLGFYLLMTLFWYRPAATNLEGLVYGFYWLLTIAYAIPKISKIKAFNKTLTEAVEEKKLKEGMDGEAEMTEAEAVGVDITDESKLPEHTNEA